VAVGGRGHGGVGGGDDHNAYPVLAVVEPELADAPDGGPTRLASVVAGWRW